MAGIGLTSWYISRRALFICSRSVLRALLSTIEHARHTVVTANSQPMPLRGGLAPLSSPFSSEGVLDQSLLRAAFVLL